MPGIATYRLVEKTEIVLQSDSTLGMNIENYFLEQHILKCMTSSSGTMMHVEGA